jgi:quercetin dioxygenase-like cupin family protein
MSFTYRRVVTGHDESGKAMVRLDERIESGERLPGYHGADVWCTDKFPVDNNESAFTGGATGPRGTRVLIRTVEMLPGETSSSHMHRTETLDYAIILSGEVDMTLDGGSVVRKLTAGDIVVQRGTSHAWAVSGKGPARLVFVLLDAHPVVVGERVLEEDLGGFEGRLRPMPLG